MRSNPGSTVVTSGREREASRLQLMTIIGTRGRDEASSWLRTQRMQKWEWRWRGHSAGGARHERRRQHVHTRCLRGVKSKTRSKTEALHRGKTLGTTSTLINDCQAVPQQIHCDAPSMCQLASHCVSGLFTSYSACMHQTRSRAEAVYFCFGFFNTCGVVLFWLVMVWLTWAGVCHWASTARLAATPSTLVIAMIQFHFRCELINAVDVIILLLRHY